jgi:hypothetical protein
MLRVPQSKCTNPACGRPLNGAGLLDQVQIPPSPGDASMCLYCRHLMIFGDNMVLREPTREEAIEIASAPDIFELQKFSLQYNKDRPHDAPASSTSRPRGLDDDKQFSFVPTKIPK